MAKFEFKEDMWALARCELREELDEEPPFSLSWGTVSIIYAVGSVICAGFGALHYAGIEQVKGFYLIFCLFPVCLLYSLLQYRTSRKVQNATSKVLKSD